MKVGILAAIDPHGGGVYQYSLMVLEAMAQLRDTVEPVIVEDRAPEQIIRSWQAADWQVIRLRPRGVRTIVRATLAAVLGEPRASRLVTGVRSGMARRGRRAAAHQGRGGAVSAQPRIGASLRAHGIELMLYPMPTALAYRCGVPYVLAVHDLQHRLQPEFPEVSANGEWEAREELFSNAIQSAEAVLVDSETGREDVLAFYGDLISPDRVRVLPYVIPPYLRRPTTEEIATTLRLHGITGRYLLFPAQFWPHKNHRRVVEAIALLHQQGTDVQVVMTGSASGPLRAAVATEIRGILDRMGIADQVRMLGYVDNDTIAALYAGAAGVILPTFFGPTNIPVNEAWAMGVPVLTSDIRGIREQCADAAILVDPRTVSSIADGIRRLCWDDDLRGRLVAAGRERLSENDSDQFRAGLATIFQDVRARLEHRQ